MQTRQSIVEMFSTFVQFGANSFSGWATDAKLRRSMLGCVQSSQDVSDRFWALYWWKHWQADRPDGEINSISALHLSLTPPSPTTAKGHLTAYLQEPCFWTARKTAMGFSSNQYTLPDCFQVAISQVDKVLSGFDPSQGFGMKSYASAIFGCVIRETLRQRHEVDICTPWGLLRKISQKRLVESLVAIASQETINDYLLAWQCFKLLYVPHQTSATKKLTAPDTATMAAITSRYNSLSRHQITAATTEKWLMDCAKAARNYLYPVVIAEENIVIPPLDTSLLDKIIADEDNCNSMAQQAELNEVIVNALIQLKPQALEIVELYYAQGATQQQIAEQLQIKQYTVSRRLTKARESLLLAIAQWSQDKLHISLTSDLLKNSSSVLEEWLQVYYRHS